jgi:hypothetical protein
MSAYYVNLIAINPKREEIRSVPVRVLVDTGSELSWLPIEVLASTGIQRRKRLFRMADGRTMDRDVGFCITSRKDSSLMTKWSSPNLETCIFSVCERWKASA